jgi:arylsulfatase A-like enzyme
MGRKFLGGQACVLLALVALLAIRGNAAAQERRGKPNVLFIAVDDLRPELGCYGVKEIKSPNIDAFARTALQFNRAYCQQAVCNPSRASLLTGRRPDSVKVWDLVTPLRTTAPDIVTLPQYFRLRGYFSIGMGKIFHNTFPDPKSWSVEEPRPKGFKLYSDAGLKQLKERQDQARAKGIKDDIIKGKYRGLAAEAEDVPDNRRFDGALTDLAVQSLQDLKKRKEPFFLGVGYILPHLPWTPPKRYWDMYDPAKLPLATNPYVPRGAPSFAMGGMYELRAYLDFVNAKEAPDGLLSEAEQRHLKHAYYASVSFIDVQIGRLVAELDRLGLAENTIVILWADHGWKLGEHGCWCKQTNYEIDTRVPMFLRAPSHKAHGKTTDALVEFVDIYPTLCELCGLPVPADLEGKSMVPLLDDPARPWKTGAFSQFPRRDKNGEYMGYAMRTERYRFVEWLNRATLAVVARELYDHKTDPQENANIADDPANRMLVADLSRQLWNSLSRPQPMAPRAK